MVGIESGGRDGGRFVKVVKGREVVNGSGSGDGRRVERKRFRRRGATHRTKGRKNVGDPDQGRVYV